MWVHKYITILPLLTVQIFVLSQIGALQATYSILSSSKCNIINDIVYISDSKSGIYEGNVLESHRLSL